MPNINNATPRVIDQGIKSAEKRIVRAIRRTIPQHLPVVHSFASKGRVGRQYVDTGSMVFTELYGPETMEMNSPYYNSNIPFIHGFLAEANNFVMHRVVPQDAKDVSNVVLFLDVLETEVPVYVKNSDGSIEYDATGMPVIAKDSADQDMMVTGYEVCYVTEGFENDLNAYRPGLQTQRIGIQSKNGVQSKQYPIAEFAARYVGAFGNKVFMNLYALNAKEPGFPDYILNDGKQYPYQFAIGKQVSELTGETVKEYSRLASTSVTVTLKEGGINPMTKADNSATTVINNEYIRRTGAGRPESDMGRVHMYYDNIKELSELFSKAEFAVDDMYRDDVISDQPEDALGFNIVSFTSSNTSPYQAVKLVDLDGTTRLTRNTDVYLEKGNSGTMTQESLEEAIKADMANYANIMTPYMDQALHPESIIYDTGFKLDVKKSLANFIALRKDTKVTATTYIEGTEMSPEEQFAIGLAVSSHFQLFPESAFFGTSTVRAMIVAGSSILTNSIYTKRIPMSYEIMRMTAGYMGAANGKWVAGKCYDRAPNTICRYTDFDECDIVHVPVPTRVAYWTNGINFVLNFSSTEKFFPAVRTIFKDDNDVLSSDIVSWVCCTANKAAHTAWRNFTGNLKLKNEQLVNRVNEFVGEELRDCFDDVVMVIPNAVVGENTIAGVKGWDLPITVVAPDMTTVMATRVEMQNFRDFQR